MELMPGGDLRNYLIKKRKASDMDADILYTSVDRIRSILSSKDLLDICRKVAAGLAHLSDFKVRRRETKRKLQVYVFNLAYLREQNSLTVIPISGNVILHTADYPPRFVCSERPCQQCGWKTKC